MLAARSTRAHSLHATDRPPMPTPAITRRKAVAALAIGAAGAAAARGIASRRPVAGANGHASGWYALLSDPHIAADPAERLRGECMADNLRDAVADILHAHEPPRGVVLGGDLAFKTGTPGDYVRLISLINPLMRLKMPLHVATGNHDDRDHLRDAVPDGDDRGGEKRVSTIEGPVVRFVILDSQDGLNVTAGRLGAAQIEWLARDLDAHPQVPAVIVVHHNPDVGVRSGLRDADSLLATLRPRRQVKAIVFGHTHRWDVRMFGDIHAINLPSTAYLASAKQPLGWVVLRPEADGAEVELRSIGGDRSRDLERIWLRWRAS